MDSKCRRNGPANETLNEIETAIDCRYECFDRADCSYFTYYPECHRCYLWNEGDEDLNVNLANAKETLAGLKRIEKSMISLKDCGLRAGFCGGYIRPQESKLVRPGFSSLEGIVSGGKHCFVGNIFSQVQRTLRNANQGV